MSIIYNSICLTCGYEFLGLFGAEDKEILKTLKKTCCRINYYSQLKQNKLYYYPQEQYTLRKHYLSNEIVSTKKN